MKMSSDGVQGPGRLSLGKRFWGHPLKPSSLAIFRGGRIEVKGNFAFHRGADVRVGKGAVLKLGSGYAADNVHIDCFDDISIGDGVAIAKDVTIMDTDHHHITGKPMTAPVRIGNRCWIGHGATILKGVTIGDGAVIGAQAVVTRDVPAGVAAVGRPAHPVGPVEWRL